MELVWFIPVAALAAVAYAVWLARDVLARDTGTPEMQEVAGMIFEGAMAFLRRQYTHDRDHGRRDRHRRSA